MKVLPFCATMVPSRLPLNGTFCWPAAGRAGPRATTRAKAMGRMVMGDCLVGRVQVVAGGDMGPTRRGVWGYCSRAAGPVQPAPTNVAAPQHWAGPSRPDGVSGPEQSADQEPAGQ